MINLLNQYDIDYIIDNNLVSIKHLNMFLYKNLNEMLKDKKCIYLPEFKTKIDSVKSDSNFLTLSIIYTMGLGYAEHSFYNFISEFQKAIINKIKEHILNKTIWDD